MKKNKQNNELNNEEGDQITLQSMSSFKCDGMTSNKSLYRLEFPSGEEDEASDKMMDRGLAPSTKRCLR